jgi:putative membrane protein
MQIFQRPVCRIHLGVPRFAGRRVLAVAAVAFLVLCVTSTPATAAMGPGLSSTFRLAAENDDNNKYGDQDPSDWTTPWGLLSQYDRNLLINVKWANLWEAPTSGQIAAQSLNPKVRAVGDKLMNDHHQLEHTVAEAAAKLKVTLPDSATPLQQTWQKEILAKKGAAADDAWANITRQAHGTVFLLIATVRASTRNDVIRAFAQSADEIVMRHMTWLESTGLVRSDSLLVASIDSAPYQVIPSWNKIVLGIVLACIVFVGTFAVVRVCARYGPRAKAG